MRGKTNVAYITNVLRTVAGNAIQVSTVLSSSIAANTDTLTITMSVDEAALGKNATQA